MGGLDQSVSLLGAFLNFKYRRKRHSNQHLRPEKDWFVLFSTEHISEEANEELPVFDSERKVGKAGNTKTTRMIVLPKILLKCYPCGVCNTSHNKHDRHKFVISTKNMRDVAKEAGKGMTEGLCSLNFFFKPM